MTKLRLWFTATIAWCFLLYHLPFFLPIPGSVLGYALAVAAAGMILLPWLGRIHPALWAFLGLAAGAALAIRPANQGPIDPVAVAGHAVAVGGALLMAQRVSLGLSRFEEAASQVVIARRQLQAKVLECAQSELYREVRRCRHFGRPLALLTVRPEIDDVNRFRNRLVEEAQRRFIDQYLRGRLAELLAEETSDCDLISECDGFFAVLVPEANREAAEKLRERLQRASQEKLGVQLSVGMSTFPDQDVTLVGLLERAQNTMRQAANGKGNGEMRRLTKAPTG